jgi:hypothetical protein
MSNLTSDVAIEKAHEKFLKAKALSDTLGGIGKFMGLASMGILAIGLVAAGFTQGFKSKERKLITKKYFCNGNGK